MKALLFLIPAALIVVPFANAGTVTLPPARDNTIFASATGHLSNGAGPAVFAGNNSSSLTRRALLLFDIASYVPAGATVTGAELRVYVSSTPNETPHPINLHRALSGWGEGASSSGGGGGAPAQPGDATWIHTWFEDSLWTTPGGDFDETISASVTVADTGFYSLSGLGLVADVNAWLQGDNPEFGWFLLGNETEASTARRIDSRESADPVKRPTLILQTDTSTSIEIETWSGFKSRFR